MDHAEKVKDLLAFLRDHSVVQVDGLMSRWAHTFPDVDGVLWAEHQPEPGDPDKLRTIMHVTVNVESRPAAQGFVLACAVEAFGKDGIIYLPMPLVAPEDLE